MDTDTIALDRPPETDGVSRWKTGRGRPQAQATASANGGAVYGLGMMGALAWFLQAADTRTDYLLAFPKAMVWPAILVYRLFRYVEG